MTLRMGNTDALLSLLQANLDIVEAGAEIGVYRGETSRKLLGQFPALHLYLVDPWTNYAPDHPYRISGDGCSRQTQGEQNDNLLAAHAAVEFAQDRCRIIRGTSVEAGEVFRQSPIKGPLLDFVFVDDDHTYPGVWASIQAWWPHLKQDGILCGHDYDHPRCRKGIWGVNEAAEEFADREGADLHVDGEVWWVRKPLETEGGI
jgi:hypothetical protein